MDVWMIGKGSQNLKSSVCLRKILQVSNFFEKCESCLKNYFMGESLKQKLIYPACRNYMSLRTENLWSSGFCASVEKYEVFGGLW